MSFAMPANPHFLLSQFSLSESPFSGNIPPVFEVTTLASGSAGNATLIRGASSAFLVDAGLSARQLVSRLALCGLSPGQLSGILLTHEHSDHTSALRVLLSRHSLPVYCNAMTARALAATGLPQVEWKLFQNAFDFTLAEFTVRPFSVPHDAVDPVGFRIISRGVSFGVLTDLGYATRLVFEMLRGIDGILIETNYDDDLLQKDMRRPWSVKQRITSRHGHLSNAAAANVLRELDAPALRHAILAHLSRDCNAPHLAETSVRNAVNTPSIHCACQETPSPGFSLI